MTIVFTSWLPNLIVMTADSAVRLDFEDFQEYERGCKSYPFPGVGCVTTWGGRVANNIGPFLSRHDITPGRYSVTSLKCLVEVYLAQEYRPHEIDGLDDVGYHIGGFDRQGRPRVFHTFWGFDRPRRLEQTKREYKTYDHGHEDHPGCLYNGRNDLADTMVQAIVGEAQQGKITRHEVTTPVGLVWIGDCVTRFAAELTRDVGPPFLTYLISPKNEIRLIVNNSWTGVALEEASAKLRKLGIE